MSEVLDKNTEKISGNEYKDELSNQNEAIKTKITDSLAAIEAKQSKVQSYVEEKLGKFDSENGQQIKKMVSDLTEMKEENKALSRKVKANEERQQSIDRRAVNDKINMCKTTGKLTLSEEGLQLFKFLSADSTTAATMLQSNNEYLGKLQKQAQQLSVVQTDTPVQGGFFLPHDIRMEIFAKTIEMSDILASVDRRTLPIGVRGSLPVRVKLPKAIRRREGQPVPSTNSAIEMKNFETHPLTTSVQNTIEFQMSAPADALSLMTRDAADSIVIKLESELFRGDGVGELEGILTNKNVVTLTTGTSNKLDLDAVSRLDGLIKIGNDSGLRYYWHRQTHSILRTETATDKQFLWGMDIANAAPSTFNDFAWQRLGDVEVRNKDGIDVAFGLMDKPTSFQDKDYATGAKVALLADLIFYTLVQVDGIIVQRDIFSQSGSGIENVHYHSWSGGSIRDIERFAITVIG